VKRGLSEGCYAFFKVLANPTRLAILEVLRKEPRSVTEIAKTLKQEQSMISHNLNLWKSADSFSQKGKKNSEFTRSTKKPGNLCSNCLTITPRNTVLLEERVSLKKAFDR